MSNRALLQSRFATAGDVDERVQVRQRESSHNLDQVIGHGFEFFEQGLGFVKRCSSCSVFQVASSIASDRREFRKQAAELVSHFP